MKTIFISSFHPLISRNILAAGVLRLLVDQGVRIVILVPSDKVDYFQETFGSEQVFVEGVSLPQAPLVHFFQLLSFGLVGVENHMVRGWKTQGSFIKYYAAHTIYKTCSRFFVLHQLFRAVARWYFHTESLDHLFTKYSPSLVVATDSFDQMDRVLLMEAARKGVRTVGFIRSWDNATTKGVFLPQADRVVVPNEVLKEEMHSIHRVPLQDISVVGIPHYDSVIRPRLTSWEELCEEVGLDPTKKTIFYSPGGKVLYQHDAEVLTLLKKHIENGDFGGKVQCLVSVQPGDKVDVTPVEHDPNFSIYTFGTEVTHRRKENEMAFSENERLNDFLYHCDLLITLVSTTAIDATAFDKPVVVIGFDPQPNLPDPVAKFACYAHFKKFLETGWVTVAHDDEELVSFVKDYLHNPERNHEKREELTKRYMYKLDGLSSERAKDEILRELNKT